ncbi:hypothetical protein HPB51_006186 [Rhipicephalus microplus]|uniref:Uncharacterized protein n=1 Tax=Rhipicephalus microplus TaxID=6941 RepID=A0A9J6E6M4_RHIMP|nr:hypothetical protein HPB51_006186 [Rhipicephalus microplus]
MGMMGGTHIRLVFVLAGGKSYLRLRLLLIPVSFEGKEQNLLNFVTWFEKVCAEEYGKYYSYNTTVGAEYTFDPQENRVLVFDSERGVKEKVCAALVNNSSLMLSLAAYDIDYDQDFEACPNLFIGRGAFRRVKALHFLKGYTPEIHDRVDPVEECIAKTYINVGNPCCPGL